MVRKLRVIITALSSLLFLGGSACLFNQPAPQGDGHGIGGDKPAPAEFNYASGKIHCASSPTGSLDYSVNCQGMTQDSNGNDVVATSIAPGVTIAWQGLQLVTGSSFKVTHCQTARDSLSQICAITLTEAIPTTLQVSTHVFSASVGQSKVLSETFSLETLGQANASTFSQLPQGLNQPRGVYTDGTHLFVADTENNRVLIWNSLSALNQAPDLVLGQPTLSTNSPNYGGPMSAKTMNHPSGVMYDGTHLLVVDVGNGRVLIWNQMPVTNGQAADLEIGQVGFTKALCSSATMCWPASVFSDGTRVFVADADNSRVLIWNSFPTLNGQVADLLLGQPDMTNDTDNPNRGGVSAGTMNWPSGVFSDGVHLFVTDMSNSRVLMWNSIPTVMQQPADVVLGQTDMASGDGNPNLPSSSTVMASPFGVFSDGTRLFVTDANYNRVLMWNSIPTSNGKAADLVLGETGFGVGNYTQPTSSQTTISPLGISLFGSRIFVADTGNSRILVWNSIPASNGKAADLVIGQPDMVSGSPNNGPASSVTMNSPSALSDDGTHFFVADTFNNRVLIWSKKPTSNQQGADLVLGQPSMESVSCNNGGRSAQTLCHPHGVVSDGTHLFVSDTDNNRVLIWNSIPTVMRQPADIVLGPPNMTSWAGGWSSTLMQQPYGISTAGGRLFVADYWNKRVLIWNSIPTVNQQPADVELGQPDMTSWAWNNGGVSAQSMAAPAGIFSDGTRLFVADTYNSRVLIWNTIPATNQKAADLVLGKPDMATTGGDPYLSTSQTLYMPTGVFAKGTRLFVADSGDNRILIWNDLTTLTTGQGADLVFGQPDMTSWTPNTGGISGNALANPMGLYTDGTRLFTADSANNRILISPLP